jgi:hypothetical protein
LCATDYERIIERVYSSVATELYKQIKQDVEQKIALLPTNYFRAVALLNEADDYASSNTIDAYEEASKLYERAFELFDRRLKPAPASLPRRFARAILLMIGFTRQLLKRVGLYFWPRMGKAQLMCARAEIGYAKMVLPIILKSPRTIT